MPGLYVVGDVFHIQVVLRTTFKSFKLKTIIIIPSNFVGSERYMRQNMEDIVSISTKFGGKENFVIMT